ncbi:hypothetical protein QBC39DRAFT_362110 [Podospora conica]|nr:hypothetical protein QBC39DRAFT_362110 [Schizothecium conicum]
MQAELITPRFLQRTRLSNDNACLPINSPFSATNSKQPAPNSCLSKNAHLLSPLRVDSALAPSEVRKCRPNHLRNSSAASDLAQIQPKQPHARSPECHSFQSHAQHSTCLRLHLQKLRIRVTRALVLASQSVRTHHRARRQHHHPDHGRHKEEHSALDFRGLDSRWHSVQISRERFSGIPPQHPPEVPVPPMDNPGQSPIPPVHPRRPPLLYECRGPYRRSVFPIQPCGIESIRGGSLPLLCVRDLPSLTPT